MIAHWIPMTPEHYREMQEELEALKRRTADADAGQERILALEEKLRRAQVIENTERDRVGFGAVVQVRNRDRNSVSEYALVGPEELEPECGRISPASPIGRALMGRRVGDTVTLQVPRGLLRLEILAIR